MCIVLLLMFCILWIDFDKYKYKYMVHDHIGGKSKLTDCNIFGIQVYRNIKLSFWQRFFSIHNWLTQLFTGQYKHLA